MNERESLIQRRFIDAIDALVVAANHPAAEWRLEGSLNWDERPGRLTVSLNLDHETWDWVYDALNDEGEIASNV